jgi:hypothetical protein
LLLVANALFRTYFFLALIGCSLSGCWQGVSRNVMATVLSGDGEVDSSTEGQNGFRAIRPGTKLRVGNVARTSKDAKLNIALLPGALVQLSNSSEIKIQALQISKDGNETADGMRSRVVRVQLNRGKIIALFQRSNESATQFTISTRQATISSDQNCLFQIQVEDTKTRLTCARGKVSASQGDHQMSVIEAGYFQEWPSNGSAAMSTADDARGQIDVTDALEAERELRQLQPEQQARRPF